MAHNFAKTQDFGNSLTNEAQKTPNKYPARSLLKGANVTCDDFECVVRIENQPISAFY